MANFGRGVDAELGGGASLAVEVYEQDAIAFAPRPACRWLSG